MRALDELAALAVHAGSPDADRLSSEALILGQALGVGRDQLSNSFMTRGIYLITVERRPESVAYLREGARLATQAGDNAQLGRALVNLSDALAATDPQAAAEAARTAAGHLRRAGALTPLTFAITNLVQALLMVGDWDAADRELIQAVDSDGLTVIEHIACCRGWLAALRGDVDTAEAMLAGLRDLRGNEDAQTKAEISLAEAFIAAAHRQPDEAFRHAQAVVALRDALGISHECVRWAWPLAARAAHELGDVAAAGDLLALLDSYQPGYLAPALQAERSLSRARLADRDDGQSAGAAFASAIASLRQQSTPYHLAHGLLDHAEHLLGQGDAEGAAAAIEEARGIGTGLHCEPLLTRADAIEPEEGGLRAVASNAVRPAPAMAADLTGILRQTSLLRSVPEQDLNAAAAASRLRSFRRGQVVFTRSDPGDTVIVVVSGRVKVTVRSADGGELTLAVIHPGGLLGELGVVDGGSRSADAETLEECQLLLIPRDTIRDICVRVPSAAQALTSSIAATLRRLTEATADLVFLDLPRRIAKILLSQPRGDNGVIRLRMSQEELAHQAGSTRQSVNAALRGFERRGWIEMRDRAVAVKQPDALGRFAGTDA